MGPEATLRQKKRSNVSAPRDVKKTQLSGEPARIYLKTGDMTNSEGFSV